MKLRKILVFLLAITFIPAMSIFASGSSDEPLNKKGAKAFSKKGVLVHWKDVKKINLSEMMSRRKFKMVLNMQNPRTIKRSPSADPVVQKSTLGRKALAMASPLITFAGMNLSSNGAGWPPRHLW